MGETETERMIDNKMDLIIKVLMKNDFKGVLLVDMEGYDDKEPYILPEKTTEKIMRQELDYAMDRIFEIRKLAEDLNNLDQQKEMLEMAMELEQDWAKVYNTIGTRNEEITVQTERIPVEQLQTENGGIGNVFDWA